jgi:hypothetical protein
VAELREKRFLHQGLPLRERRGVASYLRNPEHRELLLSGLRLAAGEAQ